MKKIKAITLTRNGYANLKRLNDSIKPETRALFDWHLVDNASTCEKTVEFAKEISDYYTRNEENLSFSKANNDAVDSNYDYTLLMNDDLEFREECIDPITPLLEILEKDGSVANVGSLLFFPAIGFDNVTRVQHAGVTFSKKIKDGKPITGADHIYFASPYRVVKKWVDIPREMQAVTAAFSLCRTADFIKAGGFDENYFYCFEDVDLNLKWTQNLKKKVIFCPNSKLNHHESTTQKELGGNDWKVHNQLKNLEYFLKKWPRIDRDHNLFLKSETYKKYNLT